MNHTANILRVITGISAGASAVIGLKLDALNTVLPATVSKPLALVAIASFAVKEITVALGDWIDNGKRDGSFKG